MKMMPFESPYTYMEAQLTLRLLSQGWTPDQIVNEIESLRVTALDDADEMYAARDRVRERLTAFDELRNEDYEQYL